MELFGKKYISYSSAKNLYENPKKFEMYMLGLLVKYSDAFDFGSAYDDMLFKPEDFKRKYVFIDDSQKVSELEKEGSKNARATNKYKDWLKEEMAKYDENATFLKEEDHTKLLYMYDAITESGVFDTFLSGDYQGTLVKDIDGIPVLIKYDCLNDDGIWISDLKTTDSIKGFKWDVFKYHYDLQGYLYERVTGRRFRWVVQEKNAPNTCGVFTMSDRTRESGEQKWNVIVDRLNEYFLSPTPKSTSNFFIEGEI